MYTSAKPYFYGTGRRKKSVARVRLYPGTGSIVINGKDIDEYFGLETLKLIINASKAILTGKKLEQKYYRRHSGYIGGLKEVQYKTLMATRPELAMQLAVKGMLPHNHIGDKSITRLKVYAGPIHNQQAQQPIAYEVK